jgi:hypothetical protein
MADLLSSSAHRKRWAPCCKEPPFPVTIETITKQPNCWGKWPVYTGYLHDNLVYIKHSGDMQWLYKMVSKNFQVVWVLIIAVVSMATDNL